MLRRQTLKTGKGLITIVAERHLRLKHFELIRMGSFGFRTHLLASPLKGAIDLFGEHHDEGWSLRKTSETSRGSSKGDEDFVDQRRLDQYEN